MTDTVEAAAFAAMDRRLDPASPAPIAVALSGGGDSLALLHLTMDWAGRHGRRVLALTVDHGLNPESVRWTAEAGAKARALGADWKGLAWEGEKPGTGLQAKARAARHALLANAARETGASALLLGHTADDIAEGDRMREAEAPGLGYLREWSPSPVWPVGRDVFLLRPLLGATRADLRSLLQARGATWLDDPANDNPAFARVRARAALEGADFAPSSIGEVDPTITELARRVSFSPGQACAPRRPFIDAPPDVAAWALSALLLCVSGTTTPPRRDELARALALLAEGASFTLSGCLGRSDGAVLSVTRAPPRQGQTPRPEEPVRWVAQRFYAAGGLYPDEASIPPPA